MKDAETPLEIGTYRAVTKVAGPNGDLFTKPETVNFVNSNPTIVTIRTGGISEILLITTITASFGMAIAFLLNRRKELKY